MILLVEAAATGFAAFGKNVHAQASPRLTRLALLELSPDTGEVLSEWCQLVRPPTRIGQDVVEYWGITDQHAALGAPPEEACVALRDRLARATRVTGYSFETHRRFCEATAADQAMNVDWPAKGPAKVCLMHAAKGVVGKTDTKGKLVWPKMVETHQHLFGAPPPARGSDPRENGLVLARAAARIYQELMRRGAIPGLPE